MGRGVGHGVIYGLHSGDGVIRYVGQTIQGVGRRMKSHREDARNESANLVHQWMRDCGLEVIEAVVLEETDNLDEAEIRWINWSRQQFPGKNLNTHDGGNISLMASPVVRAKNAESQRRKKLSDETKTKVSAAGRGLKRSAETREKMKTSNSRTFSPETRAKISEAGRGRVASLETRAKQSAAHRGRVFSDLHRLRLREASHRRRHGEAGIVKPGCDFCEAG